MSGIPKGDLPNDDGFMTTRPHNRYLSHIAKTSSELVMDCNPEQSPQVRHPRNPETPETRALDDDFPFGTQLILSYSQVLLP